MFNGVRQLLNSMLQERKIMHFPYDAMVRSLKRDVKLDSVIPTSRVRILLTIRNGRFLIAARTFRKAENEMCLTHRQHTAHNCIFLLPDSVKKGVIWLEVDNPAVMCAPL